jgi:hypothetical protein
MFLQPQSQNPITNMYNGLKNSFNKFSQPAETGVSSNIFLQSNTIIAKFAFLILVLIIFVYLFSLGISFIKYMLSPPSNPYVVYGLIDGSVPITVPQDPALGNSVYIKRSNNRENGIEFTWTVWLLINDINNQSVSTVANYEHIFNKGNNTYNADNIATVHNCPGMYLSTNDNTIRLIMDTINPNDANTVIDISNVPIRKWFHIAMRMKNTILDVYVNGVISTRLLLSNLPSQNYENMYLCQNGGFSGNLSNLRYYEYALNVFEINNIVNYGPNLTSANNTNGPPRYDYLSSKWYTYNQ